MFLIVGLDGATFDLIEPWVAEGRLPNLGKLMRKGAWGRLMAPMPPVTFPSWTTFMTGVNPGRHGILDFTRRRGGEYAVRFVNATFRRAPTIWRMMSDAGMRVCSLGIPGNYPPEPVNGYTLSGFDTPVTTRADATFAYPASFAAEVARGGGFPFADFQEFAIDADWHRAALAAMRRAIVRKKELALDLLRREQFDCFMLMFGESDTAAHHFWSLHDSQSPRFDRELREELGDGLRQVYEWLDAAVGELLSAARAQHVLVVSDHGFGGVGNTVVRINRWLADNGFLTWLPGARASQWAGCVRNAAVSWVPQRLQARLFRAAGGRIASSVESRVRFGGIDWRGTRAFSEELNYNPSIWLNVAGRDAEGIVDPNDVERVTAELTARLMSWRDPIADGPVVRRVWRRDELYSGECAEQAPDLTLELTTPGGYSYVCLPSFGSGGPAIEEMGADALRGGKLSGMSGSHRREGVFILTGARVEAGRHRGARMADLAPTIMALLGFRIERGFDGRVLDCVANADPGTVLYPRLKDLNETYYDDRQERTLQARMEQLGYL